jgi:hypothetical protein
MAIGNGSDHVKSMTIFWCALFDLKRSNPKDPNLGAERSNPKRLRVLGSSNPQDPRGSGYSIPTSETI